MSRKDRPVCIVTGGARGIGEAIVRRFRAEGFAVALLDIDEARGRALAKEVDAHFLRCDVGQPADWEAAVGEVRDQFGRLDVLVNNAGVLQMETIERTTAEDYLQSFRTNELGTFLGIRTVVAPMREAGRGAIVNLSTIHALRGVAGAFMAPYGATKAAVISLTESAALELARFGIRVYCVTPSWLNTEMSTRTPLPPELIESLRNRGGTIGAGHPWPAQLEPSEVADAVWFLSGDEAAVYNGTNLVMDRGGMVGSYPKLPTAERG